MHPYMFALVVPYIEGFHARLRSCLWLLQAASADRSLVAAMVHGWGRISQLISFPV